MPHVCKHPQMPEEGAGSPGAGAIGGCMLPDVGAGNSALVL